MKYFLVILLFLTTSLCFGEKQWVHRYVVRESYSFLKIKVGDVPIMLSHLGQDEMGERAWQTGKIVTGAHREDEEDPIWNYSGALKSITHFWDADNGDGSRMHFPYVYINGVLTLDTYENAYHAEVPVICLSPFIAFPSISNYIGFGSNYSE
ncbi:MAG: hypothetical protein V1799_06025 [bacterium]